VYGLMVAGKSEHATDSPHAGEEEPKALKSDVTVRTSYGRLYQSSKTARVSDSIVARVDMIQSAARG
jgi:hypothetical protein